MSQLHQNVEPKQQSYLRRQGEEAVMRIGLVRKTIFKLGISFISICAVIACAGPASGAAQAGAPVAEKDSQLERATRGIETLQDWYDPSTGLYKTTGWWNSGNAITVLADYARVSKSPKYNQVFANTFTAAQKTSANFLNNFYDDEGWWALAWIDAYDLTGEKQYLAMAKTIFSDMAGGWDDTCGGGIWWSKDRSYKNAIANELFLSVGAHLANRDTANSALYLSWANREWQWFAHTGMINSKKLINDGLGSHDGHTAANSCGNNGKETWSYNQGVILGGLAELSRRNADPSLPLAAADIAKAAVTLLVDAKGIIHDPCEPDCGADGEQFKGIFVRNLVKLHDVYPQAAYETFIKANAESIWMQSQGASSQFGQVWSGPFGKGNAATQSSALDALVGAAALQRAK